MQFDEHITSKDNSLIKDISKMCESSKYRKSRFILEGLRLCKDAYDNGYSIEYLFVSDSFIKKNNCDLQMKSKKTIAVSDEVMKKISKTVTPQGIVSVVNKPEYYDAATLKGGKYIALEKVQDPANIGAVARTAEALGLDGLIISKDSCDPYSPKALRAGMGAMLRLPIYIVNNFCDGLSKLKSFHTIYAAVLKDNDLSLSNVDFPTNCIVMIGNEANGLSTEAINIADKKIKIEMIGRAESLNAAAAAAIIMWEMSK